MNIYESSAFIVGINSEDFFICDENIFYAKKFSSYLKI